VSVRLRQQVTRPGSDWKTETIPPLPVNRSTIPAASDQQALALAVELTPDQLELLADHVARRLEQSRDNGFLDIEAAGRFLGGCSRSAVYHLVERGRIRAHRLGGRLLFDPAELREDVENGG
jgi:excisionase family DNA binding protein